MTDLEFKAEDFEVGYRPNEIVGEVCTCEYAAEVANRILREGGDRVSIKAGGYTFWTMRNGSLWIEGPDGDGMEASKETLNNIWKEYM